MVSSPLQVLNAGELIDHMQLRSGNAQLLILEPPEPSASAQVWEVLKFREWPLVESVPQAALRPAWRKLGWLRETISNNKGAIARLVLGDYRLDLSRHLAHTLQPREVVVLDDGNATLLVADHRKSPAPDRPASWSLHGEPIPLRHRISHRAVRLQTEDLPAVTFFTIYDLDVGPRDLVLRHRYEGLTGRFPPSVSSEEGLFLGSNIVESGILGSHAYTRLVAYARDNCPYPLRYAPHRRESAEKLHELSSSLRVEIMGVSKPVELHLLTERIAPRHVYGVISSALDSLEVILDNTVNLVALRPPSSEIDVSAQPRVARLFDRLEKSDSRVQVIGVP